MSDLLCCSFCGKSQTQTAKLVVGPGSAAICRECVILCFEVAEIESATVDLIRVAQAAEGLMAMIERLPNPDPRYVDEVKALGLQIGFGNLMHTASALWRQWLDEQGHPVGGEFVAGPCQATAAAMRTELRTALSPFDMEARA